MKLEYSRRNPHTTTIIRHGKMIDHPSSNSWRFFKSELFFFFLGVRRLGSGLLTYISTNLLFDPVKDKTIHAKSRGFTRILFLRPKKKKRNNRGSCQFVNYATQYCLLDFVWQDQDKRGERGKKGKNKSTWAIP